MIRFNTLQNVILKWKFPAFIDRRELHILNTALLPTHCFYSSNKFWDHDLPFSPRFPSRIPFSRYSLPPIVLMGFCRAGSKKVTSSPPSPPQAPKKVSFVSSFSINLHFPEIIPMLFLLKRDHQANRKRGEGRDCCSYYTR